MFTYDVVCCRDGIIKPYLRGDATSLANLVVGVRTRHSHQILFITILHVAPPRMTAEEPRPKLKLTTNTSYLHCA